MNVISVRKMIIQRMKLFKWIVATEYGCQAHPKIVFRKHYFLFSLPTDLGAIEFCTTVTQIHPEAFPLITKRSSTTVNCIVMDINAVISIDVTRRVKLIVCPQGLRTRDTRHEKNWAQRLLATCIDIVCMYIRGRQLHEYCNIQFNMTAHSSRPNNFVTLSLSIATIKESIYYIILLNALQEKYVW